MKTFDEIKQELLRSGKNNGYVTYEELTDALKGLKLDSDTFDELYVLFSKNKIDIVLEKDINKDKNNIYEKALLDRYTKINRDSSLYMYLKEKIITAIESWKEPDIYAISLFVYDELKPTLTLGYNTESNVKLNTSNALDEQEARWNYAFWLQNVEFYFEISNIEGKTIKTNEFVSILVEIVKDIHALGILKKKFGKEIPILIHELEYYEEIAIQNIRANGKELVEDFVDFCI